MGQHFTFLCSVWGCFNTRPYLDVRDDCQTEAGRSGSRGFVIGLVPKTQTSFLIIVIIISPHDSVPHIFVSLNVSRFHAQQNCVLDLI